MTNKLIGFVAKVRRLESALAARVEGASRRAAGSAPRQPLELILAAVEIVEREIQPAGRGRLAFPFTHVHVQFAAASAAAKARLELACEGPPTLQARMLERLESAGCAVNTLEVDVSFAAEAPADWSHGDLDVRGTRTAAVATPPAPPLPLRLELTVTHGTAERSVYVFDSAPIALGRGDEVRDEHQRLLRTNQVAFTEGADDVTQSVSRLHARIEQGAAPDGVRLFDDGSARGTSVIRKGRGFPVPRGTKGLRLQSGDEIVLGLARLRVRL